MKKAYLVGSLFLIAALFAVQPASSQTIILIDDDAFQEDATVAIDSLYNRNAEASQEIMREWRKSHPDHPIWTMWDAMELWWVVLEDLYDESHDNKLFDAMAKSEHQAGRLLRSESDHPDALLIRALATGYAARHYSNRGQWVKAAQIGRRSYNAYERIMEVRPDLKDNSFVEGMKLYYAAYIPDEYPAVRAVSWFLPDGDRKKGLEAIDEAAANGVFSRPEATYFMGNILLNYEGEYDRAIGYFRTLVEQYPNNGYYRRLLVRTLFNQQRSSEVISEAKNALNHWELKQLESEKVLREEILYWRGRAHYRMGNMEAAADDFQQTINLGKELSNTENRPFYSLANYFAGRTAERLEDKELAKSYYNTAIEGSDNGDVRSRARERLRNL